RTGAEAIALPPPRRTQDSVLVLDLDSTVVVVCIDFSGGFVLGALVRAVAKRFVLRKAASADPDGQLGAFRNFVGGVLFVLYHSGHKIPHLWANAIWDRRARGLQAIKDQRRAL